MAGRYRLVELVGAGGMGEVWKATDEILGRTVAVKVVLPGLYADPEFGRRFLAEARAMASVHHPGVVAIHDFGETEHSEGSRHSDGGRATFLVMEYVAGEPLSVLLSRVGRLSPTTTMDLVSQTAQALQAVHNHGIVHRDVKPANLMIRPNGAIALTDFGIAIGTDATPLTKPGMILGTVSYLAPEQVEGKPASALSDVYALGLVAYECLAGQKPFIAESPFAAALQRVQRAAPPLPADVPPHVARVVSQALATEPAQRWQTAGELALGAGRAIAGTGGRPEAEPAASGRPEAEPAAETPPPAKAERPAQPLPAAAPPGRRRWRRWRPAVAAVAAVAVVAAGTVTLWATRDQAPADAAGSGPGGPAGTASAGVAGTASAGAASAGPAGTDPSGGPGAAMATAHGTGAVGPSGGAVPGAPTGGAGRTTASPANPGTTTKTPSSAATPYPRTRTSGSNWRAETVGIKMTPSYGSGSPMPDYRLRTSIIASSDPWASATLEYHESDDFRSPSGEMTWSIELHKCSGEKVKDDAASLEVLGTDPSLTMGVASFHGSYYMTARITSLDMGLTSVPSSYIVEWQGTPVTVTTACLTLP